MNYRIDKTVTCVMCFSVHCTDFVKILVCVCCFCFWYTCFSLYVNLSTCGKSTANYAHYQVHLPFN